MQLWLLRWWTFGQWVLQKLDPVAWAPNGAHVESGIAFSTSQTFSGTATVGGIYTLSITIPANACTVFIYEATTGGHPAPTINGTAMLQLNLQQSPLSWYGFNSASASSIVVNGVNGSSPVYGAVSVYTGVSAIGTTQYENDSGISFSYANQITTAQAGSWFVSVADGTTNGVSTPYTFTLTPLSGASRGTSAFITQLFNISDSNGSVGAAGTTCNCVTTFNGGYEAVSLTVVFELQAPQPPTITASATPTSGTAPLTVAFTSTPAGGNPPYTAFAWAFGDGGTSAAQNPTHPYATAGTYTAQVTVTDSTPLMGSGNAPAVTVKAGGSGGTLGNNTIGRHRAPKLSTPDRIETTDNYGGT